MILKNCFTWMSVAVGLLSAYQASAFPPAPHHIIEGLVRDELGNPIAGPGVDVEMTTQAGVRLKARTFPTDGRGNNYRIIIPMDSGTTAVPYTRYAQTTKAPFTIEVIANGQIYHPIEIRGLSMELGKPSATTRLDLTLGEDSDGDGLPDAWERALMQLAGSLEDINGDDDSDGDGLTNLEEYHAGTYAFDENDGLRLVFKELGDTEMVFEFLGVTGRSYTLMRSEDLVEWEEVSFELAGEEGSFDGVFIPSTRMLQIQLPRTQQGNATYKLIVQ